MLHPITDGSPAASRLRAAVLGVRPTPPSVVTYACPSCLGHGEAAIDRTRNVTCAACDGAGALTLGYGADECGESDGPLLALIGIAYDLAHAGELAHPEDIAGAASWLLRRCFARDGVPAFIRAAGVDAALCALCDWSWS